MKKVLRLTIALVLVTSIVSLGIVYVVDLQPSSQTEYDSLADICYNEGKAYLATKSLSDQELSDAGLTTAEIEAIRQFSLEEALLERAQLSDAALQACGYTQEQIQLLRAYDGAPLTSSSPVLAATSDCVGTFAIGSSYSTSSISLTYTWRWSILPINKMNDTVVVAWKGMKQPDNVEFDLTPSANVMFLHYYNTVTGTRASNQDQAVSGTHASVPNYTSFSFHLAKENNNYWAKEGIVYLTLYPDSSTSKINYIDLGAGYGHQTFIGSYSFSVSPSLDVTFSSNFPPAIAVSQEDNTHGCVYPDGRCYNDGSTV